MSTTLDDHMTTARTPRASRSARNATAAQDTDTKKKTSAAKTRARPAKTSAKSAAIATAVHDAVAPEKTTHATNEALQGGAPPAAGDDLRQLIAEAAYYRAERRGFAPGGEELDWLEAEAEVRRKRRG